MQQSEAYALCQEHMNKYVRLHMQDGVVYDGVIENLDGEHVYIASPMRDDDPEAARYVPYPGFGPWGGGFGPWYGPGFGPYPRFRRFGLPLAGLAALSLFPYWI